MHGCSKPTKESSDGGGGRSIPTCEFVIGETSTGTSTAGFLYVNSHGEVVRGPDLPEYTEKSIPISAGYITANNKVIREYVYVYKTNDGEYHTRMNYIQSDGYPDVWNHEYLDIDKDRTGSEYSTRVVSYPHHNRVGIMRGIGNEFRIWGYLRGSTIPELSEFTIPMGNFNNADWINSGSSLLFVDTDSGDPLTVGLKLTVLNVYTGEETPYPVSANTLATSPDFNKVIYARGRGIYLNSIDQTDFLENEETLLEKETVLFPDEPVTRFIWADNNTVFVLRVGGSLSKLNIATGDSITVDNGIADENDVYYSNYDKKLYYIANSGLHYYSIETNSGGKIAALPVGAKGLVAF